MKIVVFIIVILAFPLVTTADQFGDWTYSSNGTNVSITGFTGPGGAITITNTIASLPVTDIGTRAFQNCAGLTDVIIPSNIITIGNLAFLSCVNLTSVTIPNSVITIESGAFFSCSRLEKLM